VGETRFLHVANGTSTTRTITAAGIPGAWSIWADPLHEGPVPAVSDAELVEVRRRFLAAPPPVDLASAESDPSLDPVNDLREWRAAIGRQDSYDELVLWFEHDLFDQVNLIQLLTWIRDRVSVKRVSLICIGAFPGHPDFKGLGELTPGELAPLLDARQPVTSSQYDLARGAWEAFRQPTPEALDRLRAEDTSALPFLAAATTRFLQEYPWTTDGLSRTERRLLELASGGAIPLRQAFPRMHDGEQSYYVADGSLADVAHALSHTSPPLLALIASSPPGGGALRGSVALTDAGRAALAGELDRVSACGIDRWFGGVHVQGRGEVWRWDPAGQGMVRR
jgi:hypothetical protein